MRDSLTQPLCASNLVGTLSAESPVIQRTSNQLASANCHAVAPMDPARLSCTTRWTRRDVCWFPPVRLVQSGSSLVHDSLDST